MQEEGDEETGHGRGYLRNDPPSNTMLSDLCPSPGTRLSRGKVKGFVILRMSFLEKGPSPAFQTVRP